MKNSIATSISLLLAVASVLGACTSTPKPPNEQLPITDQAPQAPTSVAAGAPPPPPVTPPSSVQTKAATLQDLVAAVRDDIGRYRAYELLNAKDKPLKDGCKSNLILHIDEVTLEVDVTQDNTVTNVPLGLDFKATSLEITDKQTSTNELKGEQMLKVSIDPDSTLPKASAKLVPPEGQDLGIAKTLEETRNALLAAGVVAPCFSLDSGDKSTFERDFTVDKKYDANAGITWLVFGPSHESAKDSTYVNKVTVTYSARATGLTPKKKKPKKCKGSTCKSKKTPKVIGDTFSLSVKNLDLGSVKDALKTELDPQRPQVGKEVPSVAVTPAPAQQ